MTLTDLSLHCTICFESFDLEERYPVVLPCGHTFICSQCSQRLDKCMICRTPLFITSATQQQKNIEAGVGISDRSSYQRPSMRYSSSLQQQQQRRIQLQRAECAAQQKSKQPLPIPKNLVLISLIESTQKMDKRHCDDDNDNEEEELREGIRNFAGSHGTFVVRSSEGLRLHGYLDIDDRDSNNRTEYKRKSLLDELDEENNNYMMMNGENAKPNNNISAGAAAAAAAAALQFELETTATKCSGQKNIIIPSRLEYGQTVQVVSFEGGIAKLARSAGYVRANPNQLVKIGSARDESCEREGQLSLLSKRRNDILRKLEEMDTQISRSKEKLTEARAVPFHESFSMIETAPSDDIPPLQQPHSSSSSCDLNESTSEESYTSSDRQHLPRKPYGRFSSSQLTLSTDSVDENYLNSNSASWRKYPSLRSNSCSFFGELGGSNSAANRGAPVSRHSSAPTTIGSSSSSLSSTSCHQQSGVNFRTGLSGHQALTSSNSSRSHYRTPGLIRMRGEHRGIGTIRSTQKRDFSTTALPQLSRNVMSL